MMDEKPCIKTESNINNENVIWFYDNKNDDPINHRIEYDCKDNYNSTGTCETTIKQENEDTPTVDDCKIKSETEIKKEKDDSEPIRSWDEDSPLLPNIKCEVVIDECSSNALNEYHTIQQMDSSIISPNNFVSLPHMKHEEENLVDQSTSSNNQSVTRMLVDENQKVNSIKSTEQKQKKPKDKPSTCLICNKTFSSKNHVKRHMTLHSMEKPFACDQCPFKCRQLLYLKKHMTVHTGEKPYACDYCSYRGAHRTHLINHLRTHTGEKPYACKYCEYKCATPSDIKRHTRIHTGEKPYSCRYCTYRTTAKSIITRHEKSCLKSIVSKGSTVNTKEQQLMKDKGSQKLL